MVHGAPERMAPYPSRVAGYAGVSMLRAQRGIRVRFAVSFERAMHITRVRFSRASSKEQMALFEETAPSWTAIFGTPAEDLERYWFDHESRETNIYVQRDPAGKVCATLTTKYFDVRYRGRTITVAKLGVGALPQARGKRFTARCVAIEAIHAALTYSRSEVYAFSTSIHPVTYRFLAHSMPRFYPHPERPQDPALADLALFLADYYGLEKADSPHPFVFKERRATVETPEERRYWHGSSDSAVRFFLDTCPRYHRGECLIMLAPISRWFFLSALGKYGTDRLRRLIPR